MLRAKRRRTRMYDISGNPIFNTMNSTPLQSVYKNQNTHLKQLTECQCKVCREGGCKGKCSLCGCSNCTKQGRCCNKSGVCDPVYSTSDRRNAENKAECEAAEGKWEPSKPPFGVNTTTCCKGAPQRNPILGYRKQLQCTEKPDPNPKPFTVHFPSQYTSALAYYKIHSGKYIPIGHALYQSEKTPHSYFYFQEYMIGQVPGGAGAVAMPAMWGFSNARPGTPPLGSVSAWRWPPIFAMCPGTKLIPSSVQYPSLYPSKPPISPYWEVAEYAMLNIKVSCSNEVCCNYRVSGGSSNNFWPYPNFVCGQSNPNMYGYNWCIASHQGQQGQAVPWPESNWFPFFGNGVWVNSDSPTFMFSKRKVVVNTVYKDNYAKTCSQGKWSINPAHAAVCYDQTAPHIQNRDGWMNDKYNYSTKQYLSRRCRTFQDLEFNFLSNQPLKDNKNSKSEFLTGCLNSNLFDNNGSASRNCQNSHIGRADCSGCWQLECNKNILGIDCSGNECSKAEKCCAQTTNDCAKKGYTTCEAMNNNCKTVYKRSNPKFSTQGAVSGGSRINRLKYQTKLKAQSIPATVPIKCSQQSDGTLVCDSTAGNTHMTYIGTPYQKVNSTGGINATNGVFPVSLYRNTFPTYKSNLSGLCLGNMGLTLNDKPQRCKMPDELPACKALQTLPEKCRFPCNTSCKTSA